MEQFTEEYLGELLLKKLKEVGEYETIIELVENNSEGEIYLVGGTVSRTLASALYGVTKKIKILILSWKN